MTMNTANTFARKRIDVRYLVLATLAAACMAVSSTAVHAADDSEPMKTTVRYADLNLANPQGVEQLYQRIVSAARQVCSAADGRTLQEKAQFWSCTEQSIARAVAAADQPALAALHAIKTGQPQSTARLAKR
jgi:UrcA family protein